VLHFENERFTLTTNFDMETKVTTNTKPQHGAKLPVSGVRVCTCEMPAKMKGKNQCWRCKKPFKEFLQTDR